MAAGMRLSREMALVPEPDVLLACATGGAAVVTAVDAAVKESMGDTTVVAADVLAAADVEPSFDDATRELVPLPVAVAAPAPAGLNVKGLHFCVVLRAQLIPSAAKPPDLEVRTRRPLPSGTRSERRCAEPGIVE
ncbi:MAG: hypothetical protein M1829_001471 [Trizodia sp. TS-e1964]|nr:MAG: hypothetical protein M1829_001471 [Trizodia sp. TS-e1964]